MVGERRGAAKETIGERLRGRWGPVKRTPGPPCGDGEQRLRQPQAVPAGRAVAVWPTLPLRGFRAGASSGAGAAGTERSRQGQRPRAGGAVRRRDLAQPLGTPGPARIFRDRAAARRVASQRALHPVCTCASNN